MTFKDYKEKRRNKLKMIAELLWGNGITAFALIVIIILIINKCMGLE